VLKWFGGLLLAGLLTLLLVYGTGETGVRQVVRWTARCSVCLLCLALAADGIKGTFFGWRHWAEVLRSLALSHGVHLVAVMMLALYTGGRNLIERGSPVLLLGGAIAYAFIFWGAFRPEFRVVSFGLIWIWAVFLVSYGTRAMRMPWPFAFPVALLVIAMLVRLASLLKPSPARIQGRANVDA
jgi:hypothetical protein